MDGVIVAVVTKQGQTLNSFQTTPTIVMLAKLDVMTVRAEIAEADVDKIQLGQTAWFTTLGSNRQKHMAKIERIEPAPTSIVNDAGGGASPAAATPAAKAIYYNAQFDVPNPDGKLRISMTTEVNIVLDSVKGAASVPVSALGSANRDGSYTVQVLKNGKVEARQIRTGLEDSINAQVVEGLETGDKVVLGDAAAGSSTTLRMRGPMRL